MPLLLRNMLKLFKQSKPSTTLTINLCRTLILLRRPTLLSLVLLSFTMSLDLKESTTNTLMMVQKEKRLSSDYPRLILTITSLKICILESMVMFSSLLKALPAHLYLLTVMVKLLHRNTFLSKADHIQHPAV